LSSALTDDFVVFTLAVSPKGAELSLPAQRKQSLVGATDVAHASWGSSVLCDLRAGTDEPDGTSVAPDPELHVSFSWRWSKNSPKSMRVLVRSFQRKVSFPEVPRMGKQKP
jgi:hypothetical protein